ncbi:MAG: methionine adenosyltransferase [Thermoanaerobaculia bacterium]
MTDTNRRLFSSESVTEGHPDKVADQVSDAILDALLTATLDAGKDPAYVRSACETLVVPGQVVLAGEVRVDPSVTVDFEALARQVIRDIGYNDPALGFDADGCRVCNFVGEQSGDIAMGVDTGGAGDQGMMFGFACREDAESLMPLPITLAHRLTRRLAEARHAGEIAWLRPDGKAQVTVEYEDERPVRLHTVVVSTQHAEGISQDELRQTVIDEVIRKALPAELLDGTTYHVNPTGSFVKGGPAADSGLTGRKIIVDTYGGIGRHGGGAFSGKDPTKVDRSATYMARHIAKNLVAADLADRAEVQLAYAIGVAEPVSVHVDSFATGRVSDRQMERLVRQHFRLQPRQIIESLDLLRPIYRRTAAYGHFGRAQDGFPWESTAKAHELRQAAGLAA